MDEQENKKFNELFENPVFWITALSIFMLAFVQLITFEGEKNLSINLLIFVIGFLIFSILFLFHSKLKKVRSKESGLFSALFAILAVIVLFIIFSPQNFDPISKGISFLLTELLSNLKSSEFWNGIVFFGVMVGVVFLLSFLEEKILKKKEWVFPTGYIVIITLLYVIFNGSIINILNYIESFSVALSFVFLAIFLGIVLYGVLSLLKLISFFVIWIRKKFLKTSINDGPDGI